MHRDIEILPANNEITSENSSKTHFSIMQIILLFKNYAIQTFLYGSPIVLSRNDDEMLLLLLLSWVHL